MQPVPAFSAPHQKPCAVLYLSDVFILAMTRMIKHCVITVIFLYYYLFSNIAIFFKNLVSFYVFIMNLWYDSVQKGDI